jgi:hypothetical protein
MNTMDTIKQEPPGYSWLCAIDPTDFPIMTMRHIVHLLGLYPLMAPTVMMAALNALAYQVDDEARLTQAIEDINTFVTDQVFKHSGIGDVAGEA